MKKYDNVLRYGILILIGILVVVGSISPNSLNPERIGSAIVIMFFAYLGFVIMNKVMKKNSNVSS